MAQINYPWNISFTKHINTQRVEVASRRVDNYVEYNLPDIRDACTLPPQTDQVWARRWTWCWYSTEWDSQSWRMHGANLNDNLKLKKNLSFNRVHVNRDSHDQQNEVWFLLLYYCFTERNINCLLIFLSSFVPVIFGHTLAFSFWYLFVSSLMRFIITRILEWSVAYSPVEFEIRVVVS